MARFTFVLMVQAAVWSLSLAATTITTAPTSLITGDAALCPTAECSYRVPYGKKLNWVTFTPTSTIVAATVRVIINNATNSTTTTTIFNTLPAGVELPPTNEAGTRVAVMTSYAATGPLATIAYPSQWADYTSLLSWTGTLYTRSTCTTATAPVTITLPPHPPIPDSQLYSRTTPTTDPEDPRGFFYSPTFVDFNPDIRSYATELDESAIISCRPTDESPVVALSGIKFLTETETSFTSSSSQQSSAPPPSTAQTTAQPGDTISSPEDTVTRPPPEAVKTTTLPLPLPPPTGGPGPGSSPNVPGAPVPVPQTSGEFVQDPTSPNPTGVPENNNPNPNPNPNNPNQPNPPSPPNPQNPQNPQAPAPAPPPITLTLPNNAPNAPSDAPSINIPLTPLLPTNSDTQPGFVIENQTLTPGGTITVSGTTIELDPTAPVVVVNGESETLTVPTGTGTTTTEGGGVGGPTGTESGTGPAEYTGGAVAGVVGGVGIGERMVVVIVGVAVVVGYV